MGGGCGVFHSILGSLRLRCRSEGKAKAERRQSEGRVETYLWIAIRRGRVNLWVLDTIIKNIWRYKVKTELKVFFMYD